MPDVRCRRDTLTLRAFGLPVTALAGKERQALGWAASPWPASFGSLAGWGVW